MAAARTLTRRLVAELGQPIDTPFADLDRLFPSAADIAAADPQRIGQLGIVRQRVRALQALAREVADGRIELHPGAPLQATLDSLHALPGIGEWTVQLIAMRVLAWPDAFAATDIGVLNALGTRDVAQAMAQAEAWRPWRAYAVMGLWQTLEDKCMTLQKLVAQARFDSPLGPMTVAATAEGLAGLWFDGQAHHPGSLDAPVEAEQPFIAQAREELDRYWRGAQTSGFKVRLDAQGTPFQRSVWRTLLDIPTGRTSTYAAVAASAGSARAVRAAGAAIGRNPLSIIVPCHRVLGRDGSSDRLCRRTATQAGFADPGRCAARLAATGVMRISSTAETTSSATASALRSVEWRRPCWPRPWPSCARPD